MAVAVPHKGAAMDDPTLQTEPDRTGVTERLREPTTPW
jgi:hypothetical protein